MLKNWLIQLWIFGKLLSNKSACFWPLLYERFLTADGAAWQLLQSGRCKSGCDVTTAAELLIGARGLLGCFCELRALHE